MNNHIILEDVLDTKLYHHLAHTVDLGVNAHKEGRLVLLTQNSKYRFWLPVTNRGGFSHEWYRFVLDYKAFAIIFKQILEETLDKNSQWKFKIASDIYDRLIDKDCFSVLFEHLREVLESIVIEEKEC